MYIDWYVPDHQGQILTRIFGDSPHRDFAGHDVDLRALNEGPRLPKNKD